jgi:hypothetical protein
MIDQYLKNSNNIYNMDIDHIINTIVSQQPPLSKLLNDYISVYPGDAPKWVDFLNEAKNNPPIFSEFRRMSQTEIEHLIQEMNIPTTIKENVEITHDIGCLHCKELWTDTPSVPTIEFICGHKYHTTCFFVFHGIYGINGGSGRCLVENCTINMDALAHRIIQIKETHHREIIDPLLAVTLQRDDFKADLKEIKQHITKVSKLYSAYNAKVKSGRGEIVQKHIHSINYLHSDMNQAFKTLNKSSESINLKSQIGIYRRKASNIFRKYGVSLRDLRLKKMIKVSWNIRHILERHHTIKSSYKFGIRIFPGKSLNLRSIRLYR